MLTSDTDGPHGGVVRALRAALETGDAAVLEGVLAKNVQWFGTSFGACHDRPEVIDVLRPHLESPTRPRLTDLRVVGDGLLMRVELRHGGEPTDWIAVLRLDPASRIARIQDYESAAVAEYDLTVLARPRRTASGGPPAIRVRGLAPSSTSPTWPAPWPSTSCSGCRSAAPTSPAAGWSGPFSTAPRRPAGGTRRRCAPNPPPVRGESPGAPLDPLASSKPAGVG